MSDPVATLAGVNTTPDWGTGFASWRMVQAAWELMHDTEPTELTQTAIARAAGVSLSLFRRSFPEWKDLYGELAAVAAVQLTISLKGCTGLDELVRRWHAFHDEVPRHYEVLFARAHAFHLKLHVHRAHLERIVTGVLERDFGIHAAASAASMTIAILHGSVAASRSPRSSASETVSAIRAYASMHSG